MNEFGLAVLEICKYIIPALVVFATIYFIMKKYLQQQYNLQVLQFRQAEARNTLPIKLQAYERLALFCERIKPDQLVFRLKTQQMTAGDLRTAMLIAVQKEFEHNLTQQIYVSEKLWRIISLAKDEILNLVSSSQTPNGGNAQDLANEIIGQYRKLQLDPITQAQMAIKKETELIL